MLVLDFVSTVRATRSGLLDTLSDVSGMTEWGRARTAELGLSADFTATETLRREVVELRQGVRALFAKAVAPGPVSSADADRLPGFAASLDLVNAAAFAAPLAPRLDWPAEGVPSATSVPAGEAAESPRIRAALAASAIDLLAGPYRERLRACPAPRCVLYFAKEHPRQEWCSVGCGNRARAARHYHQHRDR
ncbi:CGNR zinc finger domain-containing protein [Streptosporangium sp. NBC_01756]|uniref:CGNR zinc finger domain-containing protein n=1 Tax=Streptosporangium sp. NBC_01756 TaxID=2975950 RepID=UPI002DDB15CD|nr:ABATE domain-containing protein [Streptosporangium sp. NBC_01756]WSC83623.1 ABATE domain-containing protein [Streptosporangium sp. NBC_01756]